MTPDATTRPTTRTPRATTRPTPRTTSRSVPRGAATPAPGAQVRAGAGADAPRGPALLRGARAVSGLFLWLLRPSADAVALAFHQVAVQCESGISIVEALSAVARDARSALLRGALEALGRDLAAGEGIAQAAASHPWLFDDVALGLLSAAEADGRLGEAFAEIGQDVERRAAERRELVAAVSYPAACFALTLAFTAVIGATFGPRILELYTTFGLAAPRALLGLVAVGTWLCDHAGGLAVGVAALAAGLAAARANRRVRAACDAALLRAPLVGPLVRAACSARLAGTVGRLHERGVSLLQALEIGGAVTGNAAVRRGVDAAGRALRAGRGVAAALGDVPGLSPVVVSLARTGEASGSLGTLLLRAERTCRDDWRLGTRRVMASVRALLLAVAASAIGLLVWAVYTPILEVAARLTQ